MGPIFPPLLISLTHKLSYTSHFRHSDRAIRSSEKSEKLSKQTREMFVLVFPGKFVSIYLHAVRCRSPAFERNHPMERHRVTCGRHENAFLIDIWSKLMPKGRKRRPKRQEIFSQLCCEKMRHVSLTKSQSIRWTFCCECSSFSH